MKKILLALIILFVSIDSYAQKTDVRVEISNLKAEVAKLQTELSTSSTKNENRIIDLGAKIEDLRFEINVLKRVIEQYKNGVTNSNSTANSIPSSLPNNSTPEDNSTEKTESKPQKQSYSQCSATTKKGTRCSRSARSNGLCWQHGG
jgi:chromosome segregation ATPase